jgi:hypothetical protein
MKSFLNFFRTLIDCIIEARTLRAEYMIKSGKMY